MHVNGESWKLVWFKVTQDHIFGNRAAHIGNANTLPKRREQEQDVGTLTAPSPYRRPCNLTCNRSQRAGEAHLRLDCAAAADLRQLSGLPSQSKPSVAYSQAAASVASGL